MPETKGAIYAVGDIHGCHRMLERLLGELPIKRERDLLIFLGDYLDRDSIAFAFLILVLMVKPTGLFAKG